MDICFFIMHVTYESNNICMQNLKHFFPRSYEKKIENGYRVN